MKITLKLRLGGGETVGHYPGPVITLGRNPDSTIVMDGDEAESLVSWDHAKIELTPDAATVTDEHSTNKTYLNGIRVDGVMPLSAYDTLKFGLTGPTLVVQALDLKPAAAASHAQTYAAPVSASVGFSAPSITPRVAAPAKGGKRQAANVSETRGILLEEVKKQASENRRQRQLHERQRRNLMIAAGVGMVLMLLLGLGLALLGGKTAGLAGTVTEMGGTIEKQGEALTDLGREVKQGFARQATDFDKVRLDMDAQRKDQDKSAQQLGELARGQARIEAEERKKAGKLDELAADLGVLNRKLTERAGKEGGPAPKPRDRETPEKVTLSAGQKVSIIMKKGQYYTGSLVSIDSQYVRVQTIPDPDAKPTVRDVRDIQAFETRDGIFAYDETTGSFEKAITYYKFNKDAKTFERMSGNPPGGYPPDDVSIAGQANMVRAVMTKGSEGEMVLGLPMPASQSMSSIPAYQLKEIVTTKGVYLYRDDKGDFDYKAHSEIAAENKAAVDKYWREYEEKNYNRKVEAYKLGTDRLRAIAPLYRRWWWW